MDSQKRSTSTSNTSSNIQKHISENFLFRRFTQINQEDLYEKVQFLYSNMFGFNWDSELFNKPKLNLCKPSKLVINLPPEAYFFLVCSNYFPVSLNKLVKYQDQIYETIQKMLDRIATSKNIVKAKGLTNSKQNLIADLIGLIDPDCIKDKQGKKTKSRKLLIRPCTIKAWDLNRSDYLKNGGQIKTSL